MQISRGEKRRTTGDWYVRTFSGGKCYLDVFSENGAAFSYVFRCDEGLYAPEVNIVKDREHKEQVNIMLSYNCVFADIGRAKRVEEATKEIREFFLACQEEGILDIANIEEATG